MATNSLTLNAISDMIYLSVRNTEASTGYTVRLARMGWRMFTIQRGVYRFSMASRPAHLSGRHTEAH